MVLAFTTIDHLKIMLTGAALIIAAAAVFAYCFWLFEVEHPRDPPSRLKLVLRWITAGPVVVAMVGIPMWFLGAAALGYIQ